MENVATQVESLKVRKALARYLVLFSDETDAVVVIC
jgi:hypothetical protein